MIKDPIPVPDGRKRLFTRVILGGFLFRSCLFLCNFCRSFALWLSHSGSLFLRFHHLHLQLIAHSIDGFRIGMLRFLRLESFLLAATYRNMHVYLVGIVFFKMFDAYGGFYGAFRRLWHIAHKILQLCLDVLLKIGLDHLIDVLVVELDVHKQVEKKWKDTRIICFLLAEVEGKNLRTIREIHNVISHHKHGLILAI